MRKMEWWVFSLFAILLVGCGHSHSVAPSVRPQAFELQDQILDPAVPSLLKANYLMRPDGGERRVLRQLMHEMQQARHLIDEAHARRDTQARVRVDYARLALEFDQILLGLRRTLSATETTPREAPGISGEYHLYE